MSENVPSVVRPHRATLILVLGILGIIVCPVTGVFAWLMGNADLAAMSSGEMDRTGESMTTIGKILGIIGIILGVLCIVGAVLVFVVLAGVAMHAAR
jgi:hypothetical protein